LLNRIQAAGCKPQNAEFAQISAWWDYYRFLYFQGGLKTLYIYDTHVHTSETSSCGKIDAKTLVHMYSNAGYHGLVITDHYFRGYFESLQYEKWEDKVSSYLAGYRTALEEGRKVGLNVLLGMEIRFDENFNDYLVFGIDEDFLFKNKELYALNLKTFGEFIRNMSIMIYHAHPFRVNMTRMDPRFLHGVEVYNGNPRHNSNNNLADHYATANHLKKLSGSDFHQELDLARGGIVLPEAPSDSEHLAQLLREDRIIKLLQTD